MPDILETVRLMATNESGPLPPITAASIAKYYPEGPNFWMFAMIGLGSSFVIFVALTIYMLCTPEKERGRPNNTKTIPG